MRPGRHGGMTEASTLKIHVADIGKIKEPMKE